MDPLTHLWSLNDWIVAQALEGFEGDDWTRRFSGSNPALWLIGHLVLERKMAAGEAGLDAEIRERDRLFAPGSQPEGLPPGLDGRAIAGEFHALHKRFAAHLKGLDATALAQASARSYPVVPRTRLGALQFLFEHETYHVGQLGLVRVMLGKGSWLGNAR